MQITGREFSEATLARIRARIQGDPTLTRTALSREVCEWLDWRGPEGRPQDMSCRVALLTLARRGLIELPPAQPVSFARAGIPRSRRSSDSRSRVRLQTSGGSGLRP